MSRRGRGTDIWNEERDINWEKWNELDSLDYGLMLTSQAYMSPPGGKLV